MGVVYKARQTKLGHIVALKMTLHAQHAGEQERHQQLTAFIFLDKADLVECEIP